LYLNDDLDEFLLHFPDYRENFQPLLDRLDDLNVFVTQFVELYKEYNQKEFAAIVLKNHKKVSGAMFAIRAKKSPDFLHYVSGMASKKLDELLGIG
jgi:hypothetical protein